MICFSVDAAREYGLCFFSLTTKGYEKIDWVLIFEVIKRSCNIEGVKKTDKAPYVCDIIFWIASSSTLYQK